MNKTLIRIFSLSIPFLLNNFYNTDLDVIRLYLLLVYGCLYYFDVMLTIEGYSNKGKHSYSNIKVFLLEPGVHIIMFVFLFLLQ
jgi:hypothetical protein